MGHKAGASVAKAPPTSGGHVTDVDFKKAISLQLQNALKLVMSQNTGLVSAATRASSSNQESKGLVSLRPQSAPVTPVKASASTAGATSSPSKNIHSTSQSPLKSGVTTCKLTTAKVIASSPRKNVGTSGTTSQSLAVAASSHLTKTIKSEPSSNSDSLPKKSKLSAIESLLCEETISPRNSPGPAWTQTKDEVSSLPEEGPPPVVQKPLVPKPMPEKMKQIESNSHKIKPEVAAKSKDHKEVRDKSELTTEDTSKLNSEEKSVELSVQPQDAATSNDEKSECKTDVTASAESASTSTSTSTKQIAVPTKQVTTPTDKLTTPTNQVTTPTDNLVSHTKHVATPTKLVDTSMKQATTPTEPIINTSTEPVINISTDQGTCSKEIPTPPVSKATIEVTPTNWEMNKSENMPRANVTVEVLKTSPPPLLPPSAITASVSTDQKESQVASKNSDRERKSECVLPTSRIEVSRINPPTPSTVTVTASILTTTAPVTLPAPSPPAPAPQKNSLTVQKMARKRSPSPTSCEPPPPPKKQKALLPQEELAGLSLSEATPTPVAPSPSTTTQASTSDTTLVSVVTLESSATIADSPMKVPSAHEMGMTIPSESQTDINADSLLQSLCSDTADLEEDPDVTVLASQLGLDSVDSPIFNLTGFLSFIQPDLSVLQQDEQPKSDSGKVLIETASDGGVRLDTSKKTISTNIKDVAAETVKAHSQVQPELLLSPVATQDNVPLALASSVDSVTSLEQQVSGPVASASLIIPTPSQPTLPSPPPPPPALPALLLNPSSGTAGPIPGSITSPPILSSPVMFPEEPIPPRPLLLELSGIRNLAQSQPSLSSTPATQPPQCPPLTPTPLTPLGEGLLDLSDIQSLVDESEAMEGISQDVFESIEKLVSLDEQSTNATWK